MRGSRGAVTSHPYDTLAVTLDLPPFNHIDKKLRLRGLNCPEMDTEAGKAAKRFVQSLIRPDTEVIVTTTKPDKYDRYLADVFLVSAAVPSKDESPQLKASALDPAQTPPVPQLSPLNSQPDPDRTVVFLNNALLQNAHAVRMDPDAPPPPPRLIQSCSDYGCRARAIIRESALAATASIVLILPCPESSEN